MPDPTIEVATARDDKIAAKAVRSSLAASTGNADGALNALDGIEKRLRHLNETVFKDKDQMVDGNYTVSKLMEANATEFKSIRGHLETIKRLAVDAEDKFKTSGAEAARQSTLLLIRQQEIEARKTESENRKVGIDAAPKPEGPRFMATLGAGVMAASTVSSTVVSTFAGIFYSGLAFVLIFAVGLWTMLKGLSEMREADTRIWNRYIEQFPRRR